MITINCTLGVSIQVHSGGNHPLRKTCYKKGGELRKTRVNFLSLYIYSINKVIRIVGFIAKLSGEGGYHSLSVHVFQKIIINKWMNK